MSTDAAPSTDATSTDWTSGFSEELKSFVTGKGVRSAAELAAAFAKTDTDAAALIPPPKDGQWNDAARAKLGIPAKAEDYALTRPKLPDGVPYDDALEKAALPIAHKLGLTPHQLQGLVDFIADHRVGETAALTETLQARMNDAEQALRKDWGGAYERRVSLAGRMAKRFGGDGLIAALNESGFGNNPDLVRAFDQIASLVGEDTMKGDGTPSEPSVDAARAEIARIQGEAMKDPKHPWINAHHPEHEAQVERMRILFAAAHPDPGVERN